MIVIQCQCIELEEFALTAKAVIVFNVFPLMWAGIKAKIKLGTLQIWSFQIATVVKGQGSLTN